MSIHLPGLPALLARLLTAKAAHTHAHHNAAAAAASTTASTTARSWAAPCGTALTLRPVRPQDAALLGTLLAQGLSPASRRQRFHGAVRGLSPAQLAWLAAADFQRHAAFIVTRQAGGLVQAVAEGCWVRSGAAAGAEFALSVADAWQCQGVGRRLLQALVDSARAQGLHRLTGDVLPGNLAMQALARSHCFDCSSHPDDGLLLRADLALAQPAQGWLSTTWFH